MTLLRFFAKASVILTLAVVGQFFQTAPSSAQPFNSAAMKDEIEKRIYAELESRIKGKIDNVNTMTREWGENAAFRAALELLNNNPKALALFKKARKDGKTPEQAFKVALRSEEIADTSALQILKSFDAFVKSDGIAVLADLQKIATKGKAQLDAITKLTKEVEGAKDKDSYIALMKKHGLEGLDEFEALEKRMTKLYNFVQNPYGKYSDMFATIQKGVDGKEPGARALALFTLMEQTGSALPILGTFVEMYAEAAKELLNATLRLRKAFARWDMGCVGTGSYGILGSGDLMRTSFKYPSLACPDGKIKNLFEDFSKPDLLYFWDGKIWHKAPDGTGGLLAVRGIISFLESVKIKLPVAKSDVLTAFSFYGLPDGYQKSYGHAVEVHTGISRNWSRLKQIMASFDVPEARVMKILEQRTGIEAGFDAYLNKHFKLHQDLFVYSFLKSLAANSIMAGIHLDTHESLKNFRPKIVLGDLVLPEGVDLATVEPTIKIIRNSGALIETQSISLADRSYRIVLFGDLDTRVEYQVVLDAFVSDTLVVDKWTSIYTKHRAVFKATLGVDLTLPQRIEVGQKVTVSGQITPDPQSHGTDFRLTWFVDGNEVGSRNLGRTEFSIPLEFNQAGIRDFEVAIVDEGGISGGERTDLAVAFKIETDLISQDDGKLAVMVEIIGGGGEYTVNWRTDTGVSVSKEVGRNKFFQRFEDSGTKQINWIDLTVFDKISRVEVPLRIALDGAPPVKVNIAVEPSVLKSGDSAEIFVGMTDGQPGFDITLYANGQKMRTRTVQDANTLFSLKLDNPGEYQLRVIVVDQDGGTAQAQTSLTVEKPLVPVEEPTGDPAEASETEGLQATFQGNPDNKTYIDMPADIVPTGEVDEYGFSKIEITATRKVLVRQVVGSKLVISIDGTEVSGSFRGEVWQGKTNADSKYFDCKVVGDFTPATNKISTQLFCPDFIYTEGDIVSGGISGDLKGNKLIGTWHFVFSQGGGDWEAVKQ